MRYKVPQLLVSTDKLHVSVAKFRPSRNNPAASSDIKFLRSWLTYDSDLESNRPAGKVNWTAAFGMLLAMAVSVGFWAGLGLLIAQLRK